MTQQDLQHLAREMSRKERGGVARFSELLEAISRLGLHKAPVLAQGAHQSVQGGAFFFEPVPGVFYGSCGPCAVSMLMDNRFHCDLPVYYAHLVLWGEANYALGGARTRLDLARNTYFMGKWIDCLGRRILPAQDNYCHVAMMVPHHVFANMFGQAAAKSLDSVLERYGERDAKGNVTATGLAKPDSLALASELLTQQAEGQEGDFGFRSACLNFFAKLSRDLGRKAMGASVALHAYEVMQLTRLKEAIETRFADAPDMKTLCENVGLSVSKANRGFRKQYGMSVSRYINACKMANAYRLLRENACNVSECAYSNGYSNVGHFIAAFKRCYGVTPGHVAAQRE